MILSLAWQDLGRIKQIQTEGGVAEFSSSRERPGNEIAIFVSKPTNLNQSLA